ncbi:MAG: sigma-54 interaction domain-containing protein, partial [Planctomycetota bacterium]
ISRSVIERALETHAPVVIPNALEDPDFSDQKSVQTLRLLSVLAVPLIADGRPVACVYADSTRATGIFLPELADRLGRFAARIAPGGFDGLIGESPRFLELLEDTSRVARTEATVLIYGESGTGKELLARAVHERSDRRAGPFIPINCAALQKDLIESELFGHRKGAFTGADRDRDGKIRAANGGTIFLDEIGEVPLPVQAKLLRVLETGEVQALGADQPLPSDVRFVAATHQDLDALVRQGSFRQDLVFRLRVVTLTVPPLRERPDDILPLARSFMEHARRKHKVKVEGLSRAAEEALLRYGFPGNVRELKHAVESAAIFARGRRVEASELPEALQKVGVSAVGEPPRTRDELLEAKERAGLELERAFLEDALARAKGKVAVAARLTGTNRSVLHTLLKKHGLDAKTFRR